MDADQPSRWVRFARPNTRSGSGSRCLPRRGVGPTDRRAMDPKRFCYRIRYCIQCETNSLSKFNALKRSEILKIHLCNIAPSSAYASAYATEMHRSLFRAVLLRKTTRPTATGFASEPLMLPRHNLSHSWAGHEDIPGLSPIGKTPARVSVRVSGGPSSSPLHLRPEFSRCCQPLLASQAWLLPAWPAFLP